MQYGQILSFKDNKDNIRVKLINAKKNLEMMQKVPHIELYDLSMVFFIEKVDEDIAQENIMISNELLVQWKIELKELETIGKTNMIRCYPCYIKEVGTIFSELEENVNKDFHNPEQKVNDCDGTNNRLDEKGAMFLLTNENYTYGAVFMMYPEILMEAKEKIGESYYILPASIHGIILIRKSAVNNLKAIKKVVLEMNKEMVMEEDYLSDHIYYYDEDKGKIILVENDITVYLSL